jgi:transcription initiation factor TFIID subunit 9B
MASPKSSIYKFFLLLIIIIKKKRSMSTKKTTTATSTPQQETSNVLPKDAIIIEKILASMGIQEYEPRIIELFLELIYRYVGDVFNDSIVYMQHAGRTELDLKDIRLAIQSRMNYSFAEPPPIEFLLEVANRKNSENFGFIPEKPEVLLPPAHHCLTEVNYQLQTRRQKQQVEERENESSSNGIDHGNKRRRME